MPQQPEPVLTESPGHAATDLCGVVLAAGAGTRLRPLTRERPKALCPVAGVPLIDHGLDRIRTVTQHIAVNLHHDRDALTAHLDRSRPGSAHLSVEDPEALGTAGALGRLRPWMAGRDVIVLNADTWCPGSLREAVTGWDRQRVRLLVVGEDRLSPRSEVAGAFMPWSEVAGLEPVPSGLYEASWGRLAATGGIDVFRWDGPCVDCGTPARYLHANMVASEGASVIGVGAEVRGQVERSVIWDGARVAPGEHLVDAIRTTRGTTVLVRC